MKIAYKIAYFFLFAVLFTACKKDDGGTSYTPPRPYAEVYPEDLAKIETYLETHYVTYNEVDNGDGTKDITNIVIGKIDTGTPQTPIMDHPLLTFKTVKLHSLEYKVYYLNLFEGSPEDVVVYNNGGKRPCAVDAVLTTYKGMLLDDTVFDERSNAISFNLYEAILGWQYIFPEFRSGKNMLSPDGILSHKGYGAGVMFLPSALGYYERAIGDDITAYSPLVFIFNLHNVTHLDTDFDGVDSHFEFNYNADGTLQDTDGDGIPDYRDIDDDNDGYLTKDEITHTITIKNNNGAVQSVNRYVYPFNGAAANDGATIVDETQGIPDCSGDYATPTRKRRHLDKNCFATINLDIIQ